MNASVSMLVNLPVLRPIGAPPMKTMEECTRPLNDDEISNDPSSPKFVSTLPKDTYMTKMITVDIAQVFMIEDIGEWNEDGTFTSKHCRLYFRSGETGPILIEVPRVQLINIMLMASQQAGHQVRSDMQNQIVMPGVIDNQRRFKI